MYYYETHLHTLPVSRCAKVNVRENLKFYKEIGYDGALTIEREISGDQQITDIQRAKALLEKCI